MKKVLVPLAGLLALAGVLVYSGFPPQDEGGGTGSGRVSGRPGEAKAGDRGDGVPALTTPVEPDRPAVPDRYAALAALASREIPDADEPGKRLQRERLVRDEGFKYPLLRVLDTVELSGGGERLISQTARVADHVLIRPKPGVEPVALEARIAALGGAVRRILPATGIWVVSWPGADLDTVPRALAALQGETGLIEYAEDDSLVYASAMPNDGRFAELWGMHNTGQSGGTAGMDCDGPEAWDIHTGTRNVVVGVIDTGIDRTHQDLAANMWTNAAEAAGLAGVDDDRNGYIDDVNGWDFAYDDKDPSDVHGHGTHCSGTIGGAGNNGTGVAGVCWQVKLLAAKFLSDTGSGASSDGAEAIAYCTKAGCFLTSNSWGGGGFSQGILDAINGANAAGILFVNAAGNSTYNLDTVTNYPASYRRPNMIVVASLTRLGALSSFSNYGSTSVDLGAPGSDILSCAPGNSYKLLSGTSMACPHVAGACALMKSFKPQLQAGDIRQMLLRSVEPTPSLAATCVSRGRLNVHKALLEVGEMSVSTTAARITGRTGGPFTPASWKWTVTNGADTPITWRAQGGPTWLSYSPSSGALAPGASADVSVSLAPAAFSLPAGTYTGTTAFANITTGVQQTEEIILDVEGAATLPVSEGFETTLPPWWKLTGTGTWNARATSSPPGLSGTPCLLMDSTTDSSYARNEATLTVDLSAKEKVSLDFWVAGFSDEVNFPPTGAFTGGADFDGVAISADGVTWHAVHTFNTLSTIWSRVTLDLDALTAAKGIAYSSTFKIRFNQYDNYRYSTDGIAIDGVSLTGSAARRLILSGPASLTEGTDDPGVTLTVGRPSARPEEVTVTLAAAPAGILDIPATVTIPSGQTSVSVPLRANGNTDLDGTRTVTVNATGTAGTENYLAASAPVDVHDDESAVITLGLPAEIGEGTVQTAAGSVTLSAAPVRDVSVKLTSGTPDLRVPAAVTVLAGQTSAVFDLDAANNGAIDSARTATVTASVTNWTGDSETLTMTDDENRQLVVTIPAPITEGEGAQSNAGTVRLSGTLTEPLDLTLTTSPELVATPATLTIPAGQTSAAFSLSAVDDTDPEGPETHEITAAAAGMLSGTGMVTVYDDDNVPAPYAPTPAHLSDGNPLNADLRWECGGEERISNGGFESGDLSGWQSSGDALLFQMNDGTEEPPGPEPGIPPRAGSQSLTLLGEPGKTLTISQAVEVPIDGPLPVLRWTHRIRNLGGAFSATHQFRVTARDLSVPGSIAVPLFTTQPGSMLLQDWVPATGELRGLRGRRVELTFALQCGTTGMHVHLDEISLPTGNAVPVTWEVRIGTSSDLSGISAQVTSQRSLALPDLQPATRYWWQVTSVRGAERAASPVWEFFVPERGPLAAFRIGNIGPVRVGVPFSVSATAVDARGNVITDFDGTVPLTAPGQVVSPGNAGPFTAGEWTGLVTVTGTAATTYLQLETAAPAGVRGQSNPFQLSSDGALQLSLSSLSLTEGDAPLADAGVVSVSVPSALPLQIRIGPEDGDELAVQEVTLPAGSTAVSFPLAASDDALLDGSQTVYLRATAPAYSAALSPALQVHDNETSTLTLTVPATVSEADGTLTAAGRVQLQSPAGRDLRISLASSDTTELRVPPSVLIPAGADSVAFDLTLPQDQLADRTQVAVVRAVVPGWPEAARAVQVTDDESSSLTLRFPATLIEGASASAEVSLGGLVATATVVTLGSSDLTELRMPASVTIPAGQGSAAFPLTVVDDILADGGQTVTVSATAPFFTDGSATVTVSDNDAHHFEVTAGGDQTDHAPFTVTVRALNLDGQLISDYAASGAFSLRNGAGMAVIPTAFSMTAGTWTGPVEIQGIGQDVHLVATSGATTGESAAFAMREAGHLVPDLTSVDVSVAEGTSATRDVLLQNTGGSPLKWWINTNRATTSLAVNAYDRGFYQEDGTHTGTNTVYVCGRQLMNGSYVEMRNWFAFDLPPEARYCTTVSTTLYTGDFLSGAGKETYQLRQVWSPVADIVAGGVRPQVFGDLGDGPLFLEKEYVLSAAFSTQTLQLTTAAQQAVCLSEGKPFVMGGSLSTLQTGPESEYVFGSANSTPYLTISLAILPAWLSVSGAEGTLAPGTATVPLTLQFNSAGLAPGVYTTTLQIATDDWQAPRVTVPVSFTVRSGIRRFEWSPVPASQPAGRPLSVTLRAVDAGGTLVPDFTGTANLSINNSASLERVVGTGFNAVSQVFTGSRVMRNTCLYTSAEVGASARLRGLRLGASNSNAQVYRNFTVRMKQTSAATVQAWEMQGWTTVFSGDVSFNFDPFLELVFSVPFDYTESQNLLVDFSSTSDVIGSPLNLLGYPASARTIFRTAGTPDAPPGLWHGNLPAPVAGSTLPQLFFLLESGGGIEPSITGNFTAGVWTGDVRVPAAVQNIALRADDGAGHTGTSAVFNVTDSDKLQLTLPATLQEGAAAALGKVQLTTPAPVPLTVTLTASNPALILPASVTIPAGAQHADFSFSVQNDNAASPPLEVRVTASAESYTTDRRNVSVTEDDLPGATLTTAVTAMGEGGSADFTLTLSAPAAAETLWRVTSTHPSRMVTPGYVIFPAGQTSVSFSVQVMLDSLIQNVETATISAGTGYWPAATRTVTLTDDEPRSLVLESVATALEGASLGVAVRTPHPLGFPLTVTVTSSNPARVPGGQSTISTSSVSTAFALIIPNNQIDEPIEDITLTVTAPGFPSATRVIRVGDGGAKTLSFTPPTGSWMPNRSYTLTLRALDAFGSPITANGMVFLSAVDSGGQNADVAPASGLMSGGLLQLSALFSRSGQMTVTARSGALTGTVAITVQPGPPRELVWDAIPAGVSAGAPFRAGLRALDEAGNVATGFTGTANLSIRADILKTIGTGTSSMTPPLFTGYIRHRMDTIVLASDIGTAGEIRSVGFEVMTVPTVSLQDCSVQMRATSETTFANGGVWNSTGWTEVYRGPVSLRSGWVDIPLTTPFTYTGSGNVAVQISYSNPAAGSYGSVRSRTTLLAQTLFGSAVSVGSHPSVWTTETSGTATTAQPILRFTMPLGSQPLAPPVTGNFTAGVWSGLISVPVAGTFALNAASTAPAFSGSSAPTAFGAINPAADPDRDGLTDLMEAAMFLDSRTPDAGMGPRIALRSTDRAPSLSWRRRIGGGGYTWQLQGSPDLAGWTSVAPVSQSVVSDGNGISETVTAVMPLPAQGRIYYRVTVSKTQ